MGPAMYIFSRFVHMFSMLHAEKGEVATIDFSLIQAWLPIERVTYYWAVACPGFE